MEKFSCFVDFFMDFNKVRRFQEFCGLSEKSNHHGNTSTTTKVSNKSCYIHDEEKENYCISSGSIGERNDGCCNAIVNNQEKNYKVGNYFLHYLFLFGSMIGTEVFYITFVPVVFWNLDAYIARKVVTVWVVTMYLGQAAKDLLRWPRPTWPPVFKLETRVEAEYGLPSTHAIAGTAFPFTILLTAISRYEFNLVYGILLACFWCALVSLSRLYVGMHSILDVMSGVVLTSVYLYFGWPFMEMVDDYTLHSKYAPYIIIVSHFLLAIFYPNSDRWSTTRGDTVIILGVGAGVHSASWFGSYYGYEWYDVGDIPMEIMMPSLFTLGIGIVRTIFGMMLVLAVRALAKHVSLHIICHAVSVSKDDEMSRRRTEIEVPYKFITYTCVGFCTSFIVPALLEYINIVA